MYGSCYLESVCLQQKVGARSGFRGTNVVDIDLATASTWWTTHVASHVWWAEGTAEATTWSATKVTTAWCAMDWGGEAWLGLAVLTKHQYKNNGCGQSMPTSRT